MSYTADAEGIEHQGIVPKRLYHSATHTSGFMILGTEFSASGRCLKVDGASMGGGGRAGEHSQRQECC